MVLLQLNYVLLFLHLFIPTSYAFSATIARPPAVTDKLDTKAFAETTTTTSTSILLSTKDVVTNVVVAGATGRTGRYVVEELLNRGVTNVIALVRNDTKAQEVFPNPPSNLQMISCSFNNETQIMDLIQSMNIDAAIWCATGFATNPVTTTSPVTSSSSPPTAAVSFIDQLKKIFGWQSPSSSSSSTTSAASPVIPSDMKQQSIDLIGLPAIAKSLVPRVKTTLEKDRNIELPKMVMCSSAGVTRTIWDEEKKQKYIGAADIPIVRLNPFNILDRKRESEALLRRTSSIHDEDNDNNEKKVVKYCIVRPCGLNDSWPQNSRPVFTQGDVAVGRLHRRDLAKILVDTLTTPEALYKTFEVVGLANYPPASSGIGPALARLHTDMELEKAHPSLSDEIVFATYTAMQQLLPGETQDAAALAMGQTYEQLDKGTVGRLGVRGQEVIEGAVVPNP